MRVGRDRTLSQRSGEADPRSGVGEAELLRGGQESGEAEPLGEMLLGLSEKRSRL